MRNLFLLLLLANLALLGWQQWLLPPPAAPGPAPGVRPLALLPLAEAPRAAARRCVAVGPFAEGAVIAAVSDRLRRRGFTVGELQRPGQDWLGHWVQVANLGTLEDAESARRRLVAGGLSDAYIMQVEEAQLISLGVFRERGRAEAVAGRARELGYLPRISDRSRTVQERWLRIELPPGAAFDVGSLGLPPSQIKRSEEISCDAARETEAEAAAAAEE